MNKQEIIKKLALLDAEDAYAAPETPASLKTAGLHITVMCNVPEREYFAACQRILTEAIDRIGTYVAEAHILARRNRAEQRESLERQLKELL